MGTLYTLLFHEDGDTYAVGQIPTWVVKELVNVPDSIKGEVEINHEDRTVLAFSQATEKERSQTVATLTSYWRENKTFQLLSGWRNELFPVYGRGNKLIYNVERAASGLFGVVTYGIHMTAYVSAPEASHGIKLWVPRRSATKQTYGGMLDNTVAGGLATGEEPFGALVRECAEEASLPEEIAKNSKGHGAITYSYIRDSRAGGETGLCQPEVEHVYDLELPTDVVPKPCDTEVECFYLWTVENVQEAMKRGEFKPNCAMVLLDFFIRRGIINKENEEDYDEITRRLHRNLTFPGPHRAF